MKEYFTNVIQQLYKVNDEITLAIVEEKDKYFTIKCFDKLIRLHMTVEDYSKSKIALQEKLDEILTCIDDYAIEDDDYNKIYTDEEKIILKIIGESNEK